MKKILFFLILFTTTISSHALVWQWSVDVEGFVSPETNNHPKAFLWIPENCKQVRSVVVGQHNMCEETIFNHPIFRKAMSDLGFAIIWVTPGFEQKWDVNSGCQNYFDKMLKDLADVSGYTELRYAPIVPLGHSAMATYPWNFAAWNPERTLAIISYHGDAPRTNLTGYGRENVEWGRTRNIDGIPGLMIEGEYEWWEARVNPALAFRMMYPESCISFLCDAGRGHFDVSDDVVSYIIEFLKKSAEYRLPQNMYLDKKIDLVKIDVKKGWLAQRWHPDQKDRALTAPYSDYKGDSHDAFWYFDGDIAKLTEEYYTNERNRKSQYIGFVRNGNLIKYNAQSHGKYNIKIDNLTDDLNFNIKAVLTDSSRTRYTNTSSTQKLNIYKLCGPVEKVNDTTFTIRFYNMDLDNIRRTASIWLIGEVKSDETFKTAVQEISFDFPYPQTKGKAQSISFGSISDVKAGVKSVKLNGKSDSGLPVYYYVREGPAQIIDNKLVFTEIPPRTKYPVKITVVAWQYGRLKGDKVQTANSIEQSFYIKKIR